MYELSSYSIESINAGKKSKTEDEDEGEDEGGDHDKEMADVQDETEGGKKKEKHIVKEVVKGRAALDSLFPGGKGCDYFRHGCLTNLSMTLSVKGLNKYKCRVLDEGGFLIVFHTNIDYI